MATTRQVKEFLKCVAAWARGQPDILSLALVGSHARGQANVTSDVDLVLIVDDPDKLLLKPGWTETFGRVRRVQIEHYGRVTSLRAWYLDDLEVEFGLTSSAWAGQPLEADTRQVIEDGLRVLYERENLLGRILENGIDPNLLTG